MSVRRILPVASGKGGVGKSTFAMNFALALSRVAPTALVDLDTGTSSVRNTLDAPIERDLYHFFKRGEPLERCLTTLPSRLDPAGQYRNFAFIAAPQHAMELTTALSEEHRLRLMRSISALPVTYVVLDLRAGLDTNVLDFLPHSNSGILVFTPHHPAATMAAADIVKALIFRKLRLVFAADGPLAENPAARGQLAMINGLLDRVEDPYDTSIPNLDHFLRDLVEAFGDAPLVRALAANIETFGVYFVLNLFDGLKESFDKAIKPFVASLQTHTSTQLNIYNLGWIVTSDEVHRANCQRWPLLLHPSAPAPTHADPIRAQLEELAEFAGLARRESQRTATDYVLNLDPRRALVEQLEVLSAMGHADSLRHVRHNFAYIARRALHVLENLPADQFGQVRLLSPLELFEALSRRRD